MRSSSSSSSGDDTTNPLNLTFSSLPQTRSPGQKSVLPTTRETSSIPRGSGPSGNWEYPSPQQMYNAMRKKGYDDTPEDAVESMVAVHNFLNEGAWGEIVVWEKSISRRCAVHSDDNSNNSPTGGTEGEGTEEGSNGEFPRLVRFQGRSKDLTPKARLLQILGKVYPDKFGGPPPFDRHDWYVLRQNGKEVRYVIDYYSAPSDPNGDSVFYLDVRPAVDRPGAILERVMVWGGDIWERASGADVRRAAAAAKEDQDRDKDF